MDKNIIINYTDIFFFNLTCFVYDIMCLPILYCYVKCLYELPYINKIPENH